MTLLRPLVTWLDLPRLPAACLGCQRAVEGDPVPCLCRRCAAGFDRARGDGPDGRPGPGPFEGVWPYDGPLAGALSRFKYGGERELAGPLGRALAVWSPPRDDLVIVPVPSHWLRRGLRGFEPSLELARVALAQPSWRRLGVLEPRAVARPRRTEVQAGAGPAERRRNVVGAFAVRHAERLRGRHVLVVDDVVTTGATMLACFAAIEAARPASVTGVALLEAHA